MFEKHPLPFLSRSTANPDMGRFSTLAGALNVLYILQTSMHVWHLKKNPAGPQTQIQSLTANSPA